jgi:periplasmic protein TonB
MTYAMENQGKRRAQALVAVGLLHGAAIWAIASGFAGGVVNIVRDTLVAQQWKDEVKITPIAPLPPPPNDATPTAKPDTSRTLAPRSDTTLAPLDPGVGLVPIEIVPVLPSGQPSGLPTDTGQAPTLKTSFTTRSAAPKSAPGSWVSDRDYPTAAIREEREGTTRFRLAIGTDGKVTGCEITASSGSADLDAATCAKVSARARFIPALGSDGMPVSGSYSSAVRWILP